MSSIQRLGSFIIGCSVLTLAGPVSAGGIRINEIRTHPDEQEYFELIGPPGASLDGMAYIVLGDSVDFDSGRVEEVISFHRRCTLSPSGFFLVAEPSFDLAGTCSVDLSIDLNFEDDDNVTHMLIAQDANNPIVVGMDLDVDDDGCLDGSALNQVSLLALIIDSAAVNESCPDPPPPSEETEYHYGPPFVSGTHAFFDPLLEGWNTGGDTPGLPNYPDLYSPPVITTSPESVEVVALESAGFSVVVESTLPVEYQWFLEGVPLVGEQSDVLVIDSVGLADVGQYSVLVMSCVGATMSDTAVLSIDCGSGNVNAASGSPQDVLFINGQTGDPIDRTVTVPRGVPIEVSFQPSDGGPSTDVRYVLWIWRGAAENPHELVAYDVSMGCTVNPTPINMAELPQPIRCVRPDTEPHANCTGVIELPPPPSVPWAQTRPSGFGRPVVLTLQGVLFDDASLSPLGASITNKVVLVVP